MHAQEFSELPGVQMIGVIRNRSVLRRRNQLRCEPVLADCLLEADRRGERDVLAKLLPVRRQVDLVEALRQHEWMVVVVVRPTRYPACELRALLECGLTLTNELGFG